MLSGPRAICTVCGKPSSYRFCSNACARAAPRSPGCAICEQRNDTTRICEPCRADPANAAWSERSDLELATEDVDISHVIAGDGRLEALQGGRRKLDSEKARLVMRIALERPQTMREIAQRVGCSHVYVIKVLRRLRA